MKYILIIFKYWYFKILSMLFFYVSISECSQCVVLFCFILFYKAIFYFKSPKNNLTSNMFSTETFNKFWPICVFKYETIQYNSDYDAVIQNLFFYACGRWCLLQFTSRWRTNIIKPKQTPPEWMICAWNPSISVRNM